MGFSGEYRGRLARKLAWHYVRGVPLAAVGFIGFLLSVLKTETLQPMVGGACKAILFMIPFVEPGYRFIPCLDFSAGVRGWGPEAAKILAFVVILAWGAVELAAARKIREVQLDTDGTIFRDRPSEFPDQSP